MKKAGDKFVSALHDADGKVSLPEGVTEVRLRVERRPGLTNKDIGEEGDGADGEAPPAHWTVVYRAGAITAVEIREANNETPSRGLNLRGACLQPVTNRRQGHLVGATDGSGGRQGRRTGESRGHGRLGDGTKRAELIARGRLDDVENTKTPLV